MERIRKICSYLFRADVFADIGCDHGYCSEYMLKNDLCRKAYISDISAKSLRKAETLLEREIRAGRCVPVVADGLRGIPEQCDLALIAGMGGEEIVKILSFALPQNLVLQPMKNADKVRAFLSGKKAFVKDETFKIGSFYYDIIVTGEGKETLSPLEIKYGRDNVNNPSPDFRLWVRNKLAAVEGFLSSVQDAGEKQELSARREELRRLL